MAKKQSPAFDKTTDSINERGAIDGNLHADGCPTIDLSQDPDVAHSDYAGDGWDRMESDTIAQANHNAHAAAKVTK